MCLCLFRKPVQIPLLILVNISIFGYRKDSSCSLSSGPSQLQICHMNRFIEDYLALGTFLVLLHMGVCPSQSSTFKKSILAPVQQEAHIFNCLIYLLMYPRVPFFRLCSFFHLHSVLLDEACVFSCFANL